MPVTKLSSLNSSGNSEETWGSDSSYLPAAGGGFNNDFNDANIILQGSLGLASAPTQDLERTPSNVPTTSDTPIHTKINVDAVLLD